MLKKDFTLPSIGWSGQRIQKKPVSSEVKTCLRPQPKEPQTGRRTYSKEHPGLSLHPKTSRSPPWNHGPRGRCSRPRAADQHFQVPHHLRQPLWEPQPVSASIEGLHVTSAFQHVDCGLVGGGWAVGRLGGLELRKRRTPEK